MSEDEIRVIAKDEAEKLIKATVKNSKGEVREVGADSIEVSVSGYSGTFSLKPGEQIVSIDGKPITAGVDGKQRVKTSMALLKICSCKLFLKVRRGEILEPSK